jgi:cyclopropane fatty-acyl-phospholipid synthase-like methyltransferase
MNSIATPSTHPEAARPLSPPDHESIRAYFVATQEDYRRWSRGYNMHFGYFAPGMNPFDREAMLERMNAEVVATLGLRPESPARVLDIGCGTGATARSLARAHRRVEVTCITIVPEQIELGRRLTRAAGFARRIGFMLADFTETWLGRASHDAAFAIESLCYASDAGKNAALAEAARVLKPGGRITIVDGFLVSEVPGGIPGWIYRRWCACWSIAGLARLDEFTRSLERAGFEDVHVRDLFTSVAVSALHIPWVATTHLVRELWVGRGHLSDWRWRHIGASWLSLPIGVFRGTFRYCIVTARRKHPIG